MNEVISEQKDKILLSDDPAHARRAFLNLLVGLELELRDLFADLAKNVQSLVQSAAAASPTLGFSIDVLSGEQLRQEVAVLVQSFFLGVNSKGTLAPFEEQSGKVIPLSPFMKVLWPKLMSASNLAVERHRSMLRTILSATAPELLPFAMTLFDRKTESIVLEMIVSEQEGSGSQKGTKYELAFYEAPHTWVAPDGYRLSDRIWRISDQMRKDLDEYLTEAIASGYSAMRISQDVERFLKPGQDVPLSLMPYGGKTKVVYNAMRLARTEIAAAHNEADWRAANSNPAVESYRILLSNRHTEPDICDTEAVNSPYAKADRLHVPPFHPNCLCTLIWELPESVEDLIERLRTEIEQEFPGAIKQGRLQLEGIRLPDLGVARFSSVEDLPVDLTPEPELSKYMTVQPSAKPGVPDSHIDAMQVLTKAVYDIFNENNIPSFSPFVETWKNFLLDLSNQELAIASGTIQPGERTIGALAWLDAEGNPLAVVGWELSTFGGIAPPAILADKFLFSPRLTQEDLFALMEELFSIGKSYADQYSFVISADIVNESKAYQYYSVFQEELEKLGFGYKTDQIGNILSIYLNNMSDLPEVITGKSPAATAYESPWFTLDQVVDDVNVQPQIVWKQEESQRSTYLIRAELNATTARIMSFVQNMTYWNEPYNDDLSGYFYKNRKMVYPFLDQFLAGRADAQRYILLDQFDNSVFFDSILIVDVTDNRLEVRTIASRKESLAWKSLESFLQSDFVRSNLDKEIVINVPFFPKDDIKNTKWERLYTSPHFENITAKRYPLQRFRYTFDIITPEISFLKQIYDVDQNGDLYLDVQRTYPERVSITQELGARLFSAEALTEALSGVKTQYISLDAINEFVTSAREGSNFVLFMDSSDSFNVAGIAAYRIEFRRNSDKIKTISLDDVLLITQYEGVEGLLFSSLVKTAALGKSTVEFSTAVLEKLGLIDIDLIKKGRLIWKDMAGWEKLIPTPPIYFTYIAPGSASVVSKSSIVKKQDLVPLNFKDFENLLRLDDDYGTEGRVIVLDEALPELAQKLKFYFNDKDFYAWFSESLNLVVPEPFSKQAVLRFAFTLDPAANITDGIFFWEDDAHIIFNNDLQYSKLGDKFRLKYDRTFFLLSQAMEQRKMLVVSEEYNRFEMRLLKEFEDAGLAEIERKNGFLFIKLNYDELSREQDLQEYMLHIESRSATNLPSRWEMMESFYRTAKNLVQTEPSNWDSLNVIQQYRIAQENSYIAMNAFTTRFYDEQLKEFIAKNLAEQLSQDPQFVDFARRHFDDIVDINKQFGGKKFIFSTLEDPVEEVVAWMIKAWAFTSSDEGEVSVALQLAAQREFGLPEMHFLDRPTVDRAMSIFGEAIENGLLGKFLRLQYEMTQEHFRKLGITRVWMWRGMSMPIKPYGFQDSQEVPDIFSMPIFLNPLSSFSSTKKISDAFTEITSGLPAEQIGVTLFGLVDVEHILSLPLSGFGCRSEHEYVVKSSLSGQPIYVIVNREKVTDEEVALQLLAKQEGLIIVD